MITIDQIHSAVNFHAAIKVAVSSIKAHRPEYDWVGVYLYNGKALSLQDDHYLGAAANETEIPLSAGICGAAATARKTIVVDDVSHDDRYIPCSLTVQSEIVVPILSGDTLVGVLDLDSDKPAAFEAGDRAYLEYAAAELAAAWANENSR